MLMRSGLQFPNPQENSAVLKKLGTERRTQCSLSAQSLQKHWESNWQTLFTPSTEDVNDIFTAHCGNSVPPHSWIRPDELHVAILGFFSFRLCLLLCCCCCFPQNCPPSVAQASVGALCCAAPEMFCGLNCFFKHWPSAVCGLNWSQ